MPQVTTRMPFISHMGKTIIGVRPWGQERVPTIVEAAADVTVGWNRASVVDAVRSLV